MGLVFSLGLFSIVKYVDQRSRFALTR